MQNNLQVSVDKISVIYDGIALDDLDINADGIEFRNQHQIPPEAFAVGLVGLLIPWKGQELFLDAAILLRDKIPKLKMLIVGGTPDDCSIYEAELRQRVIDQQLQDIVSFTGHVATMAAAYKGLDVVVSASTSPEPLGTVVIESMAMARPLIGPDHGGAAEMLEHNQTGLLFKPNDAVALATQIERYYLDAELRTRLGKNARKRALATFSIEAHTDKIQKLYDRFLS
jgi:glycosyltransferase involved in cell wall biosynthesis